jgi:hypothetical protein
VARKSISDPNYIGPQVYIATNTVDGMKYIGKTIHSFNFRHKYLDKGHDFSRAYHRESHNWNIKIFPCKSEAAANKLEYEKVTNWHVRSKKYYNQTTGGQGGTTESRARAKADRLEAKKVEAQRVYANRFNSHQFYYEKDRRQKLDRIKERKALPKKILSKFLWGLFYILISPFSWIAFIILNKL